MVKAFLPSEATATSIVFGGTLFVVCTHVFVTELAVWILSGPAPDRSVLEPLLLILGLVGPALLAGVMFCLPEKEGLWKPGLWAVSLFLGWYLFPRWIFMARLGPEELLASLLFALIGLMVIYASVALTRSPQTDEGPSKR